MEKLKVGDEAPEIVGDSVNMGVFRLSALRGKERVFLVFSRYFGCPLCQLDFKNLLERAEEIQRYGKIVYINQSGEESAKNYLKSKVVPFPVIPDPKETYPLYKAYGIGDFSLLDLPRVRERAAEARRQGFQHGAYERNERQSPANFIISKEGKIEYAHYGILDLEKAMEAWLRTIWRNKQLKKPLMLKISIANRPLSADADAVYEAIENSLEGADFYRLDRSKVTAAAIEFLVILTSVGAIAEIASLLYQIWRDHKDKGQLYIAIDPEKDVEIMITESTTEKEIIEFQRKINEVNERDQINRIDQEILEEIKYGRVWIRRKRRN